MAERPASFWFEFYDETTIIEDEAAQKKVPAEEEAEGKEEEEEEEEVPLVEPTTDQSAVDRATGSVVLRCGYLFFRPHGESLSRKQPSVCVFQCVLRCVCVCECVLGRVGFVPSGAVFLDGFVGRCSICGKKIRLLKTRFD